jgi:MFS family permease
MSSAASYRPIVDGFEDDLDLAVEDDSVLLDSAEQNQSTAPAPSPSGEQTKAEVSSKLAAPQRPRLSYFNLITLSAYWFGWSVLMMPLLVILVPHQIVQIAGEEGKGATLGITLLLGSICSLFCSPAFGAFSDTCKHQMGRRRPFMIVGACIASVSLIVMSLSKSLALFTFSFFVLSLAMPMIMAPYSALIPDVVPEEQRGVTSGWLGAFSTLGFFCGGVCRTCSFDSKCRNWLN